MDIETMTFLTTLSYGVMMKGHLAGHDGLRFSIIWIALEGFFFFLERIWGCFIRIWIYDEISFPTELNDNQMVISVIIIVQGI